ncbi:MAG: hypothetical protein AAFX06_01220 [Planctomycetota bacterium]
MRIDRRRRGYVLLLVIAVMVLLMTALAALSKVSLKRALAASDARIRLQQRLGAESLEQVLLNEAAGVFDRLEKAVEESRQGGVDARVPTQLRGAVSIGGVTFDVLLADEDAKLNLNTLYHAVGQERTRRAIGEVAGPAVLRSVRLNPALSPTQPAENPRARDTESDTELEIPPAFRSWGEVFDLARLSSTIGDDAALPNVTSELTCWAGEGINVKRATDEAFTQTAACVMSQGAAERLVSRYRENPAADLRILIQTEGANERERLALRRLLSESSSHHSLWLDASAVARRSMRSFSVLRKTEDGTTVNERFAF